MKKKVLSLMLAGAVVLGLTGCGGSSSASAGSTDAAGESSSASPGMEAPSEVVEAVSSGAEVAASSGTAGTREAVSSASASMQEGGEKTEIQVFIAASLNTVMTEIAQKYNETHPDVTITFNTDSSGTLLTQIEEGYACDLFFSAAQKQMDTLQEDGLVLDGTRHNVVNNQVCVITLKDSGTKVTGLENLGDASSIALADGSVPVGKYTRTALMNLGILPETEEPSVYTTQQVSEALGGVEISEQGNVSKVLNAVVEGSCEVGTTYYSDTYGYEDKLDILQKVNYDLTGNVIYPIAQVKNDEADSAETAAAADFENYILSDEAKAIFQNYYFDTDVSDS